MIYNIREGIKGFIFDLDGTLADSMPLHLEGWKKACSKFGVHIDTAFLKVNSGSPGKVIAAALIRNNGLNGNVTVDQILDVKLKEFYSVQHLIKPIDPVVEIVKRYHGTIPMAIGTGGHRKAVERTLEVTGLKQYFDIIVTANDVTNFKPHPETFLKCADIMQIKPENIEVFEDGDLGIEAARSAGMSVTDVRSWYPSEW